MGLFTEVLQDLCLRWRIPDADLLACRFDNELSKLASNSKDPLAVAVDALVALWNQYNLKYAFSPLKLYSCLLHCIEVEGVVSGGCRTPTSPDSHPADSPISSFDHLDLLSQGPVYTLLRGSGYDGIAVEAQVLRDIGFSD